MAFFRSALVGTLATCAPFVLAIAASTQQDGMPPSAPPEELPEASALISGALDKMAAAERRDALKSISLQGTMAMDPPMEEDMAGPQVESFAAKLLLPDKYHLLASFTGGESAVATHDGEHGWQSDPGDPSLSLMDENDAGMFALIVPHSLLLAIDKLYPVRKTEEAIEIEGAMNYRVSLATAENGEGIDVFIHAETGRFTAIESDADGAPVRISITEWSTDDGINLPSAARLDLGMGEMGPKMNLTYSDMTLNDVDEAVFKMPEEIRRQLADDDEGDGGGVDDGETPLF
jgi:hypothetical protein